jgi:hypothetical protein
VSLLGLSYVQLAYLTSCAFGSAVCFLLAFGLKETLAPERRVPSRFPGTNPNPQPQPQPSPLNLRPQRSPQPQPLP